MIDADQHEAEPTQPTQPEKGEPIEIPVPKVSTIRGAIRKVAQPLKPSATDDDERD